MEKYIVDKTIGTGAFGNAILVKDKRSGQQYVVKTILISKVIFKETFIEYKVTKIYSHLQRTDILIVFLIQELFFYYNGSFVHTKKKLVEQAQKALYAVYHKIRNMQLPIDLQLNIFDSLVAPILLYGSEVWVVGKNDNIENNHFLAQVSYCHH